MASEIHSLQDCLDLYWGFLLHLIQNLSPILKKLWAFVGVFLAFAYFIHWNGGSIVLGDKSHHQVTFHWPQMYYFGSFTTVFLAPHLELWTALKEFWGLSFKRYLIFYLTTLIGIFLNTGWSRPRNFITVLVLLILGELSVLYFT